LNFKEEKMYPGKEELYKIANMLGKDFNSKYELIGKLGEGGFGEVYKVKDKTSNKLCALKILDIGKLPVNDEEERKNAKKLFIREAQLLKECAHPNIVEVIDDVSAQGSLPYILMQYIEGESLSTYLKKRGELVITEVLEKSESILPALAHIHSKGLVHKDLKPENIMLEAVTGRIVIIDFGLARTFIDLTTDVSTVRVGEGITGSPLYMAPELWEKRGINLKADIYSYGVILFQMLTGEVPFKGDYAEVKNGHLEGNVSNVRRKNPAAPSEIQKVIEKAMAKDSWERYADANALLDAIRNAKNESDGLPSPEIQRQLRNYIFKEKLKGHGLFSKVYSVRHTYLGDEFVLKIMDFDLIIAFIEKSGYNIEFIKSEFKRRTNKFNEKAKFFRKLDYHPNIVKITDASVVTIEHDNNKFEIPYLVCKRTQGLKLNEFILKEKPLELDRILNIALNILSALKAIHEKDNIYWEVIPEKIFIEEKTDNAILLSAGLQDFFNIGDETFVSQTKLQTDARCLFVKNYIPTKYSPWKKGIAWDISLFGLLLYQMLTGKSNYSNDPFLLFHNNNNTDEEIFRKVKDNVTYPEIILKQLIKIVMKTMFKDLRRHYRNVKRIMDDIEKIKKNYLKLNERKNNAKRLEK
jgi:serine/threonine protein kinase